MNKLLLLLWLLPNISLAQHLTMPPQLLVIDNKDTSGSPSDSLFVFSYKQILINANVPDDFYNDTTYKRRALQQSILYLDTLIDRGYNKERDYWLMGVAYQALNDYFNSIQNINVAIYLDTTNYAYFDIRANDKEDLSDYYGALTDYTKALYKAYKLKESDYTIARIYEERAKCRVQIAIKDKSHPDNSVLLQALADVNNAITLNNRVEESDCIMYFTKGSILYFLKENSSALQAFSTAGELGCKDAYDIIKEINNENK